GELVAHDFATDGARSGRIKDRNQGAVGIAPVGKVAVSFFQRGNGERRPVHAAGDAELFDIREEVSLELGGPEAGNLDRAADGAAEIVFDILGTRVGPKLARVQRGVPQIFV